MRRCHCSWQSMNQHKICGLLGLCKKAGKMITGTDMVLEAVRSLKRKPCLVLLANDASANTLKKVSNCCSHYSAKLVTLPIDGETLAKCVGKTGAIALVGINDEGFAGAIGAQLSTNSEFKEQREENV